MPSWLVENHSEVLVPVQPTRICRPAAAAWVGHPQDIWLGPGPTGTPADSRTTHIALTIADEVRPDHRTGQLITSTCA